MLNQVQRNGLVIGVMLAGATLALAGADDTRRPEDLARARLDIARRAYEQVEDSINAPPADEGKLPQGIRATLKLEQLIAWSRRWMEAERDASGKKADHVAAIDAHRKRLKKWEDICSEVAEGDSSGASSRDVDLLKFHRLEAEYWLAKAKDER